MTKIKFLLFLFLTLALLICNCGSNEDRFTSISQAIVKGEPDYYALDPIVGHIHRSNAVRNFKWAEHYDGIINMKTNNLGFRRDTDTIPDKRRKIRILVTGDSHIDGVLNNSESCCTILENLLNQSYNDNIYEVLNGGVGYYFPHNYLGVIKKYLYLSPDIFIVILYGGNDFLETCKLMDCKQSHNPNYYARLKEVESFNPGGVGQGLNQIYYFKYFLESIETAFEVAMGDIHAIKEICDAHHIMLIVLLLPSKLEIEWSADELRLNNSRDLLQLSSDDLQVNLKLLNKTAAWLRNEKINYLNLYDYMKGKDHNLFWNKDYHLNDYGHKIIAETLFATCRDIFPQAPHSATK